MDILITVLSVVFILYIIHRIIGLLIFYQMLKYANIDPVFDLDEDIIKQTVIQRYREKSLLLIYSLKRFMAKYFNVTGDENIDKMMTIIRENHRITQFGELKIKLDNSSQNSKSMRLEAKKLLKEWNQYHKMSNIAIGFIRSLSE